MYLLRLCLVLCCGLFAGCLNPQEGLFQCQASADCPTGWSCENNVCVDPACVSESSTQFCARLTLQCGSFSGPDNCGRSQTYTCGSCATEQTCVSNHCQSPVVDGGHADGGVHVDAGHEDDGGIEVDGGQDDGGIEVDGGHPDGGVDGGHTDAGVDGGHPDGGPGHPDGGAAVLEIATGDGQTGPVSSPLLEPLGVFAHNQAGAPLVGQTVLFMPPLGGLVSPGSVQTDAQGKASVFATLGNMPGPQTFTATMSGLVVQWHEVGTCAQGQLFCDSRCVPNDALHCGSCNNACPAFYDCGAGGVPGICAPRRYDCSSNADCTPTLPLCDPGLSRCVQCTKTADCSGDRICFGNMCEACSNPQAPPFGNCNMGFFGDPSTLCTMSHLGDACDAAGKCCTTTGPIPCGSDDQCSTALDGHVCGPAGTCVECAINSQCGTSQICTRSACVAGSSGGACVEDSDCGSLAATTRCDTDSNACVECVSNSDCAQGVCESNDCRLSIGATCANADGSNRKTCQAGLVCEGFGTSHLCTKDCTADSECGPTSRCSGTAPPSAKLVSVPHSCLPMCATDGDCGAGNVCLPLSASGNVCLPDCAGQSASFCSEVYGYPSMHCAVTTETPRGACVTYGACMAPGRFCLAGRVCLATVSGIDVCVDDCRAAPPVACRDCPSGSCDENGNCRGCPADLVCDSSSSHVCLPCLPGQQICGDTCKDLQHDPTACGGCGHDCGQGASCEQGQCQCGAGTSLCADTCIDTTSDPMNCGDCGRLCGPIKPVCRSGTCGYECLSDAECPGSTCNMTTHQCVTSCTTDAECAAGSVCTDQVCVDIAGSLNGALWDLRCTGSLTATSCSASDMTPRTLSLGGTAGVLYDVKLHLRGVVEQKAYSAGCRSDGTSWVSGCVDNDPTNNLFRLQGASLPQSHCLNSGTPGLNRLTAVDYEHTVRLEGGTTVTLEANVSDGEQTINTDGAGSPISISGTLLPQPYDGQFIQMDVVSVTLAATPSPQCGACLTSTDCSVGLTCDDHLVCVGCASGLTRCGPACFNLATDHANCGSCGHACAGNAICLEGTCTAGCSSDASCPPLESCNVSTGVCSGGSAVGPAAGNIGAACTGSDCSTGANPFCIDEASGHFRGGYCSAFCSTATDCGAGSVCTTLRDLSGNPQSLCVQSCTQNDECRPGYNCVNWEGQSFCLNQCQTSNDCPSIQTQTCNPFTGLCATRSCTTEGDCAGSKPHCDAAQGVCVQCTTSAQCGSARACTNNLCLATDTCNILLNCIVQCQDQDCSNACGTAASFQARGDLNVFLTCLSDACPNATPDGVCNPAAPAYSGAACAACQEGAQASTGACRSQLVQCLNN